jgi:hypothetical protein
MKKKNKTKRYIVIEFDGTTTRACTFRSPGLNIVVNDVKGLYESEARLHPDDEYDQCEGIRIALKRIGFEIVKYPFDVIFERFQEKLTKAILTGESE